MPSEPLSASRNTHDAPAIALERVATWGRQWLANDPEQLRRHFNRQAEQLLHLRAELRDCQATLRDCQAELQQLQEESPPGSVAPFRRTRALRNLTPEPSHPYR